MALINKFFEINKFKNYTIITITKEVLNTVLAPNLRSIIVDLINEGEKNIIVDLPKVNYIDASGLSVLLTTGSRLTGKSNGKIIVVSTHLNVKNLFKNSSISRLLILEESIDDAVLKIEKEN